MGLPEGHSLIESPLTATFINVSSFLRASRSRISIHFVIHFILSSRWNRRDIEVHYCCVFPPLFFRPAESIKKNNEINNTNSNALRFIHSGKYILEKNMQMSGEINNRMSPIHVIATPYSTRGPVDF